MRHITEAETLEEIRKLRNMSKEEYEKYKKRNTTKEDKQRVELTNEAENALWEKMLDKQK